MIAQSFPRISPLGVDGFLVSFGDKLAEPANRAALAFRAALERESWRGVEESSTSLASAYLRFDLAAATHVEMQARLEGLLNAQDWCAADLPGGRRLWRIPTVYGTALAPQLEEAARAAGVSAQEAVAMLSRTRVRVQTIGFAPGQPYLGELPENWDIPRQTKLTDNVPQGALVVAIRQLVLFSVTTPTGWRHIGQTAFRLFRPESDSPFTLRPGDEVLFPEASAEALENMRQDPEGGASCEPLT
ncbi:carboxyltransferase domain-containing protein [Roseovarius faecimaris]|uniref:Carboxyltransferase domain-containing protein n=1 Tax=Roseovarius faecimaris TaxID=2494550 RepID=A0A6I6IPR6_9RHOB|nr:carboxyltransferase domain-containing protein [Roseovarius faecimaris]QGX99140.1 carboxyltransferase domain-containing protein [Roseovarius faecimaris]